jgi:hypothetical protein
VNTTAGVRSTFNNGLFGPTSYIQGNTSLASSTQINLATQRVTQKYRQLIGLSQANLPAHISILQGHLPQSADVLQIALTSEAATYMHVKVGDVLTQKQGYPFTMQVVGIFQPRTSVDTILPSEFLLFTGQENKQTGIVTALVSSEGFIQADNALMQYEPQNHPWFLGSINWYYRSNQQVNIDQLNTMLATFAKLEQENSAILVDYQSYAIARTYIARLVMSDSNGRLQSVPRLCQIIMSG